MYFLVKFKEPYDTVNQLDRIAIVIGTDDDQIAARRFRVKHPNAEKVRCKAMRGNAIIVEADGIIPVDFIPMDDPMGEEYGS